MHRKHLRATVGTADVDIPTGTFIADRFLYYNGIAIITVSALRGPVSSTDNAVTRWDGTTGTLVQNSVVIIDDAGAVTGVTTLNTRDPARWVDGPVSGGSTDNAVARWDGTTGRLIQNSVVVIDDTGNITGATIGGVDPARWVQGPTPATSTDNAIARWDGTSGRLIQNSTVLVDDAGNFTSVTTINARDPLLWVQGPASAVTNRLASFNGTTGKLIQDSGIVAGNVVTNPGVSTDNAVVRWDGTSGTLIQNSVIIVSDTGAVTGVLTLNTRDVARWTDGPAAGGSTDSAVALWDGITGRLLKNSNVTVNTGGDITTPGDITPGTVAGIPTGVLVKSSGATPHPDNVITRWSSAAGHPLKDSTIVLSDTGAMTSMTTINGIVVDDIVTNAAHTGTLGNIPKYTAWFDIEDSGVPAASIVLGPASSVSTNLAGFAGTTGKQIYDTGLKITDTVRSTTNSTDNAVVRWDGTVGNVVQNSVVIISDTGAITGVTTLNGSDANRLVALNTTPGSATPGGVVAFAGITGKLVQDTGILYTQLVLGPASGGSTDNTFAVWDGTTGRLLKNGGTSAVTVDPGTGEITTPVGVLQHSTNVTHTDNAVLRRDGTGQHIQDSTVIMDDSGNVTGLGTLNTRTIANWVESTSTFPTVDRLVAVSSAGTRRIQPTGLTAVDLVTAAANFGTDNLMLRSDGASKGAQASAISIDDSGNMTNVGTINGVAIGGAGGNQVSLKGSLAPNATVTTTLTIGSYTPVLAGDWSMTLMIPYTLTGGTGGTIGVTATWGSGLSGSVGLLIGNAGAITQTSGTNITVNKTAVPTSGIMIVTVNVVDMTTGTGIVVDATSTTAAYRVYPGTQLVGYAP